MPFSLYHLFWGIWLPKYSLKSFMSSREVFVSGVLTCLFPATTVESLTLQVSRSGLLSSSSWHKSGDSYNSTSTNDTQSTHNQINIKEGDKQGHTAATQFKLVLHPENSKVAPDVNNEVHCNHLFTAVKSISKSGNLRCWRDADNFWQYWDNSLVHH